MPKKKIKKNESSLREHKRKGKELNPPFLAHGFNITASSWFNERLPEMLWAVLAVGNVERKEALNYFRYIAKYVESNHDCFDVTLTGISRLPDKARELFIKHFAGYSHSINEILRPLLLFPEIPCFTNWKEALSEPNPNQDWQKLGKGVDKTLWHQSQEATDCRWVKVLCKILGGKILFSRRMAHNAREILEYPNYGYMQQVRPSIRAMEIGPSPGQEIESLEWPKHFWKYCYDHTECVPEEIVHKKISKRQKELAEEIEESRKHYFDETVNVRGTLIDHFFATTKTSAIDSRHDGAFGLALYALSLFIEIIFYRTALSITGRLGLRALVETYITFSYLLKKEKTEPRVWDDYRLYGSGQIKLVYLKLKELEQNASSIELSQMDLIANEDKWVEFIPINLGHWISANLREMAEEVKLKDLYDKFYNYASGFMHGNWGAVRESIYQKCINPLHRYHIVPTYDLPLMPSVTKDALDITNSILACLSEVYPEFNLRFTKFSNKNKRNLPPSSGEPTNPTKVD